MKSIIANIKLYLRYLTLKAKYSNEVADKEGIHLTFKLHARWYSPFFWLLAIALLLVSLIEGVLMGIISGISDVKESLSDPSSERHINMKFKEGHDITDKAIQKAKFILTYKP